MTMKKRLVAALGVMVAGVAAMPAAAQDDAARVETRAGDVLLRARAITVAPNERSGSILPAFPGEKVRIDNSVMPELDLTYMATDNIGFELIASTTKHHADGRTGTTGGIGRLASTWVLPPTLTMQYHFMPRSTVRPYVGAGINYTIFWNEKASPALEAAVGRTRVHMKDSVGWAAQAGIDIDLSRKVFLNLDVKYIDIDTTARLDTAAAGTQRVRLNVDPLVFGVGLGLRL
ncbi:OmpW/AlkL family protein [Sphingomonas sp. Ag1]|jgi:outer membrane protein|uniref:OmpW/AlkL family protein n=1 Tax=Sphingomonas sp. Ag1 TaxID=1642949 RepID=UPI0006212E01|nr:OmpW family outer membrane protein [Sphingomonas sp. Ag1]KKI19574.1 membrane protein [Sphingomonas sp. Ag1]